MEIGVGEAVAIQPEVTLSLSGHMVLKLGRGFYFLSSQSAMSLADMLAEASMLGDETISVEDINEIRQ
tara:strand:+ start:598 stop:801 length:204 start_codon:yes stop_codon:yes gene_type:complete